jgi:hypothetical protein
LLDSLIWAAAVTLRWSDLAFAVSQPYHAFPETDGSERSQKDTKATPFEFRRPPESPLGHSRTRRRHGSGP